MEKIDYKHGRFNIATTNTIDYDDFPYEEYVQDCEINGIEPQGSDSDDYDNWVQQTVDDNYEQDMENIKECKQYQTKVCREGVLGLWYGKVKTGAFVFDNVYDAVKSCIGRDANDVDVYYEDGHIEVQVHHHDGTNVFIISALSKKGVAKAKDENMMDDPKPWDKKRLPYLYNIY